MLAATRNCDRAAAVQAALQDMGPHPLLQMTTLVAIAAPVARAADAVIM